MTPLDIKADDIVPANKYLSITSLNHTVDEIKEATVLVDDTRISSVKPTGTNTFLVSVFDVLTNTDLVNSQNASVEMRATTSDGNDLVGTDVVDVVDPTNILSGDVADTVESTGVLDETSGKVVDSVESVDILSESSDGQSQSQMY